MTLDKGVQELIEDLGIRNSHLLSMAPTGTISSAADNISASIEPVYSIFMDRTYRTFEGDQKIRLEDYGHKFLGVMPKVCSEVSADEHVDVLCTAALLVDSAVSKTCNVSANMPWKDFKNIYMKAWENGAKGCTTFNPGGKRFGILEAIPDVENTEEVPNGDLCEVDFATGRRSCE